VGYRPRVCQKVLKQEDDCFFEEFHTQDLQAVIDKQQKLITQLKERGTKMLPNILVVVDDFADDVAVARRETLLHQLFMRGRHSEISTLIATQNIGPWRRRCARRPCHSLSSS
jgi:DNA segregation ATPase FtsK/SpoIIIE-like protein